MPDTPRKYLAQDERRLQLLETGLRLFGNRSYEEISIDDIAAAADVSKGLIYHYFSGKRAFYYEVVRLAANRLRESVEPDDDLGGTENLRRGLVAYFGFVEERADAYLALMHGGLGVDDAVAQILSETRDAITRTILDRLQTDPTPNLELAIRSWIGGVEAAALNWLAHRDIPRSEVIKIMTAGLYGQLAATMSRTDLLKHIDPDTLTLIFGTSSG